MPRITPCCPVCGRSIPASGYDTPEFAKARIVVEAKTAKMSWTPIAVSE